MRSAYWILEQLANRSTQPQPMQGGESRERASASSNLPGAAEDTPETNAQQSRRSERSASDHAAQTKSDDGTGLDVPPELVNEIQDLRSALRKRLSRSPQDSQDSKQDLAREYEYTGEKPFQQSISELENIYESLSARVTELEAQHEADIDNIEGDVASVQEAVEENELAVQNAVDQSNLQRFDENVQGEIFELQQRLEEFAGRMDELETSQSETADSISRLTQSQADLEARITRELDGIEGLFQHFLDRTDRLEQRIETLSASVDEPGAKISDHLRSRREFADLI